MKRQPSIKRDKRINRNFVDPSGMKASWLKALVCIFQHGKPVPYVTGHAFCTGVHHGSIDSSDHTINWKVLSGLFELKLAYVDGDGNVNLTGSGRGIGRSLNDKPIMGYD